MLEDVFFSAGEEGITLSADEAYALTNYFVETMIFVYGISFTNLLFCLLVLAIGAGQVFLIRREKSIN